MTASLEEADALRSAGIRTKIVCFAGQLPEQAAVMAARNIVPSISSPAEAEAISQAALSETSVYVKVDAGFGRLGVPLEDAQRFVGRLITMPKLALEGIYTHLPFEDEKGRRWAEERLAAFAGVINSLGDSGISIPVVVALSSSGVLAGISRRNSNAVCVGHALYGLPTLPDEIVDFSAFRPVFKSLRARLTHIAQHPHARAAGLGGEIRYRAGARTGVVPVGLMHGYRQKLAGGAAVLVRGRRVPVLRVSMTNLTIDLTSIDEPTVGEEVVLIGSQATAQIGLQEASAWFGLSALEFLMGCSARLPYIFKNE